MLERIREEGLGWIMIGLGGIIFLLSIITSNVYMHLVGVIIFIILMLCGTYYLIKKKEKNVGDK